MSRAGTPGLDAIRSDVEHRPKRADPFAVSIWPALDVLHERYGEAWHVGYAGGWWRASPAGAGEPLRALSPDDLERKIRDAAGGA